MYARYIPPRKESKGGGAPAPPVDKTPLTATPNLDISSGLYARYIPPPKPSSTKPALPKRIVFTDDDDATPTPQPSQAEQPERKPKRVKYSDENKEDVAPKPNEHGPSEPAEPENTKKEKKRKKTKSESKHPDPQVDGVHHVADKAKEPDPPDGVPTELEGVAEARLTAEEKKKKRQKKNSKETAQNGTREDDAGSVAARHKSLLEKKEKALKKKRQEDEERPDDAQPEQVPTEAEAAVQEPHGLDPLPQPEPVAKDLSEPSYETLPPWLVSPIRVSPETSAPFSEFGLSPEHGIPARVEKALQAQGWQAAFAVQAIAIPLLLPSRELQGDLVISAATGSGKTLAYVLPMVRDISRFTAPKLRGLVVVPTRELVQQVQAVCEACARAYSWLGEDGESRRVRIGIAMGSQSLKKEQEALVEEEQFYDPAGYEAYMRNRKRWPFVGSEGEDLDLALLDGTTKPLPYHVVRHIPAVDILICTPGRLVEHINSTPGFSLDFVRWLVVDEADKLLSQSFQQWLGIVMEKLKDSESGIEAVGARQFEGSNQSGVRKVILSATMTRDLSLLNSLELSRPRHIILEGAKRAAEEAATATEYALPELLKESAVKIREESHKPLYLVELLCSHHMMPPERLAQEEGQKQPHSASDKNGSDATSSDGEDSSGPENDLEHKSSSPTAKRFPTTVLIFARSNENALRLSRLIAILAPQLEPLIGTLTSTTRTSERRKTIRAFAAGKTRILVASDLTARGIDLPHLDHVVNYDMPPSAEAYVHRVGRTARAGRAGHAWTLFTKREAGWFWPEVAGQSKGRGSGGLIARAAKVELVDIGGAGETAPRGRFSDERISEYEAALEELGREAGESRKSRG